MFGMYDDKMNARRTPQGCGTRRQVASRKFACIRFLENTVRPLLKNAGAEVGLTGKESFNSASLLVEVGGVTYKLTASVDHE